jgi:hypothetical protein
LVFENIKEQFCIHSRGRGEQQQAITGKSFALFYCFLEKFAKFYRFSMSNVSNDCNDVLAYFHKVMLK